MDTSLNFTILSQMDFSLWDFIPGFILFILAGILIFYHLKVEREGNPHLKKRMQKREKKVFPITIKTPVTETFTVNTLDISSGGAFLDYEDLKKNKTFINLLSENIGTMRVGDLIDIEIPLGQFKKFQCQACLVRINFSDYDISPKGMAIKFVHLSEEQEKTLNSLIYNVKKTAS